MCLEVESTICCVRFAPRAQNSCAPSLFASFGRRGAITFGQQAAAKARGKRLKLTQTFAFDWKQDRCLGIASRLSRAKIKCSICSSQFNTWDAQQCWALVLIVCLNRGRRFKACFARPRVVPVLQYLRVRPTPTTGGFLISLFKGD